MKRRNNTVAKIMAAVALGAIVIGIIGTGAIFVFSTTTSAPYNDEPQFTQEQLDALIEQYSGSIDLESLSATGTASQE